MNLQESAHKQSFFFQRRVIWIAKKLRFTYEDTVLVSFFFNSWNLNGLGESGVGDSEEHEEKRDADDNHDNGNNDDCKRQQKRK